MGQDQHWKSQGPEEEQDHREVDPDQHLEQNQRDIYRFGDLQEGPV